MAADILATQGTRASAMMELTFFSLNFPLSVAGGLLLSAKIDYMERPLQFHTSLSKVSTFPSTDTFPLFLSVLIHFPCFFQYWYISLVSFGTDAFPLFFSVLIHFPCFFPGYCFLLFQDEMSVQALIEACIVDDDKLYWCVSSPTMKDKPVSGHKHSLYSCSDTM